MKASSIHLGHEDGRYYFSWVDDDFKYHSIDLNVDQVVLLASQAMQHIVQCDVRRKNGPETTN